MQRAAGPIDGTAVGEGQHGTGAEVDGGISGQAQSSRGFIGGSSVKHGVTNRDRAGIRKDSAGSQGQRAVINGGRPGVGIREHEHGVSGTDLREASITRDGDLERARSLGEGVAPVHRKRGTGFHDDVGGIRREPAQ